MNNIHNWDNTFAQKKKILEQASDILKQEFVGLDDVIDAVIDAVNPWFLFPEIQDKPVIVNLWGLTGTGKTSLVKRLGQLIQFQERMFRFDMGEAMDDKWALRNSLDDVYDYNNGEPLILLFDEFQHARTKDKDGDELSLPAGRIIWELLDSGKFTYTRYIGGLSDLMDFERALKRALKIISINVENGVISENSQAFKKLINNESWYGNNDDTSDKPVYLIPESVRDTFYVIMKTEFENRPDFDEYVNTFTTSDVLIVIDKILKSGYAQVEIDCSKSLIFITGNLDEAYTMSGNLNPDMDADDFYHESKKITITQIKHALKKRFRNEQIARLGNIHIIYPALTSTAYKAIIRRELDIMTKHVVSIAGVCFSFDESVEDLVYKDGVFPAQGTRPVFASLHQLVKSQISRLLIYQRTSLAEHTEFVVSFSNKQLWLSYENNPNAYSLNIRMNLMEERKEKRDDAQAVTAVHESGHIILSALLMHIVPQRAFSQTLDVQSQGFVWIGNEDNIPSKKQLVPQVACYMGGLMAEKIIFGEENITLGSENDIYNATQYVLNAYRKSGWGNSMMHVDYNQTPVSVNLTEANSDVENMAMETLKDAQNLAEKTLIENKELLLRMSIVLSEKRSIEKAEMQAIIQQFASDEKVHEAGYFERKSHTPFRQLLKDALNNY